ncbi:penicillin-binding protein [Intrasporangium oryzae NRRL B-24470]|uniref:Penicillin-binding protein n=1 Tax=Intrasporangium oryzae NRRL B-24470 TaxID=1386089 RepID=W9G7P7_9MICO|nr:transglycosylase domain-containing protein [Intrasporangium oryzae]EWT02030.1 penicillin-binding protein [Intrasporangium oryzae NRRL B-24470]
MTQSRHEIRAAQLAASKRGGAPSRDGNGGAAGTGRPSGGRDYPGRAAMLGSGSGSGSGNGVRGTGGGGSGGSGGDGGGGRDWKRWALGTLKWGSIVGAVLVVMGIIGVFIAYNRMQIPQPNQIANLQVSIVYYSDGKTELDRIAQADGNRESVKLDQVPKFVQDAHIAAEDRTFYANNGISLGGILRAIKTSVTGEAQVGGSTITQQYVKNYFLSQDRTISRKAKEILIAMKIDGELSKSQILENYLNTIYYGRGAYGVQSASKAYFNKDVSKLTVPEAAVLASVINAPSLYDPANGPRAEANLVKRVSYVLDGMVEEGWLSAAERAKYTELPKIQPYKGNRFSSGATGFITAAVKRELLANGITDEDLDKGGLRIVTTIDKKAQANAVKAMKDNLPDKVQGGLVAIRPGDGAVVAMYGGDDYAKRQLNNSTQAILQGGSNFKPFAVLAAVRDGISTKTQFDGNSPQEFKGYPHPVNNFGGRSYGMVDMRRMIGRSINTAFVALNEKMGPPLTRQAAIDAGIPEKTLGLENDLGNVLGTASPHVIDMASAYSTIAAQGVRSKPYFVTKVTSTTNPDFVYEAKPQTRRAFDKDITADVTDAMTYTVKPGGTATKIGREMPDRPVAAKTGTSEESKSIWFSGFVPQLAVSVGLYKPDANGNPTTLTNGESSDPLTGATVPADIWLDFMKPTMEGVEVLPFPARVGVGDDKIVTPTTTTTTAPTTTTTAPPTTTTQAPPTTQVKPTKTKDPGPPTPTDTGTVTLFPTPTLTTTTTKPGKG